MNPTFLIVIGGMRSGTTLLSELLYSTSNNQQMHPDIAFSSDKSTTFRDISSLLKQDVGHSDFRLNAYSKAVCKDIADKYDGENTDIKSLIREILTKDIDAHSPVKNKNVIGIKQTHIKEETEILRQCFDNLHTIVCIRDPRDIFASLMRRTEDRNTIVELYATLLTTIDYFFYDEKPGLSVVKYEDSVTDTKAVVKKIIRALNLDPDSYKYDLIESDFISSNSSYSAHAGKGLSLKSGIFDSSIGAYKQNISPDQEKMISALFGSLPETHGYNYVALEKEEKKALLERWFEIFKKSPAKNINAALFYQVLETAFTGEERLALEEKYKATAPSYIVTLQERNERLTASNKLLRDKNSVLTEELMKLKQPAEIKKTSGLKKLISQKLKKSR